MPPPPSVLLLFPASLAALAAAALAAAARGATALAVCVRGALAARRHQEPRAGSTHGDARVQGRVGHGLLRGGRHHRTAPQRAGEATLETMPSYSPTTHSPHLQATQTFTYKLRTPRTHFLHLITGRARGPARRLNLERARAGQQHHVGRAARRPHDRGPGPHRGGLGPGACQPA